MPRQRRIFKSEIGVYALIFSTILFIAYLGFSLFANMQSISKGSLDDYSRFRRGNVIYTLNRKINQHHKFVVQTAIQDIDTNNTSYVLLIGEIERQNQLLKLYKNGNTKHQSLLQETHTTIEHYLKHANLFLNQKLVNATSANAKNKKKTIAIPQNPYERLLQNEWHYIHDQLNLLSEIDKGQLQHTFDRQQKISKSSLNGIVLFSISIVVVLLLLILMVFSAIQRHRQINSLLEKAKEKSEELNQAKSKMVAVVSHEIRNPIHALKGFIDQLERTKLSPQQNEYLSIISSSVLHLELLSNEFLDYNLLENKKIKLHSAPFCPAKDVQQVVTTFQQQAKQKGITLSFSGNQQPVHVLGDSLRFKQIAFNLLSNALKFTDHGGIEVHLNEIQSYDNVTLELIVKDSGIGMNEEHLSRLFEPFEQANETIFSKYKGTGLGMSIVKELLDLMDGSILVASELNKGTLFTITVTFPSALEQKTSENFETSLSILIIDDEAFNRQLLKELIQKENWNIYTAENGKEGFELMQQSQIDIAIVDLNMPVMDGHEFFQAIQNSPYSPHTIALSAVMDHNLAQKLISQGWNAVLSKPFTKNEILEVLEQFQQPKLQLDFNELQEIASSKETLIELLELFLSMLEKLSGQLNLAVENQNLQEIQSVSHQLLGPLKQVKAHEAASLLKRMEKEIIDFDEIKVCLQRFSHEKNQIEGVVKQLLEATKNT